MTDVELLEKHRSGNDRAFADLVRRHLGWVYGMARRRLLDAHLAEDVAQAVFVLLHRKAPRFPADGAMINWLHKTTWYATEAAAKTEKRRRKHETEAATMQPTTTDPSSSEWEELAPLLDQLIERLSKADREAVLLRYFREMSFAQVAAQIGTTEDTARKRVERAIGKLREMASGKGIEISASALAVNLTQHVIVSPPAGLIAASTGAATAPAGSALLTSTLPITKGAIIMAISAKLTVIGVAAAAALVVSGGVWIALSSNWFAAPTPAAVATMSNMPAASPMPAAGPIPILPRPADQTWLLGNAFPKLAPFSAIRWQGTTPQVLVNGTWYEWVALDGMPVTKIVEGAQTLDRHDWQKRINEDLVELLARLDHPTGQTVSLDLRDLTSGETKTFPAVAMTEANRQSIVGVNTPLAVRVAPFSGIRWQGTTPQVLINGTWNEWLALDDLPVSKLVDASQQLYHDLWQKRINEDLVDLLIKMNHPTGPTVRLDLRDLTTGQTTTLPAVAMTAENRLSIMQQDNKP